MNTALPEHYYAAGSVGRQACRRGCGGLYTFSTSRSKALARVERAVSWIRALEDSIVPGWAAVWALQ